VGWPVVSDIPLLPKGFGEIPGTHAGQRFLRRHDLRIAGIHVQPGRGIDSTPEGARAVVFSGGYSDDSWTKEEAWYTGEGGLDRRGRQVHPQELRRGNLALQQNVERDLPVRVARKVPKGNDFEYVYEGLYRVIESRFEAGLHGVKVYRFLLRRIDNSTRT
jgi:[histone H3]-lysine9 N-trimethyltransferase EHMT